MPDGFPSDVAVVTADLSGAVFGRFLNRNGAEGDFVLLPDLAIERMDGQR